ncbi:hypothetical protein AAFF_G00394340 [Aldrovandia affinis]|uniref:Uncharacterized protein n=1 Tax=Aldrovandia affinis TaxID=143900 RepID=A0AAD7WL34_9TELE|nr:hypothetical protein AAFF_G00394340 [Aldrovandia affinis]
MAPAAARVGPDGEAPSSRVTGTRLCPIRATAERNADIAMLTELPIRKRRAQKETKINPETEAHRVFSPFPLQLLLRGCRMAYAPTEDEGLASPMHASAHSHIDR